MRLLRLLIAFALFLPLAFSAPTDPWITLNSPGDGIPSVQTPVDLVFTYNAGGWGADPTTCSVYLDGSSLGSVDVASGASGSISTGDLAPGTSHSWYVICGYGNGETTFYDAKSATYTFTTYEDTPVINPSVMLELPQDNAVDVESPVDLMFSYNAGTWGASPTTCTAYLDGSSVGSTTVSDMESGTIQTGTLENGKTYNWYVACGSGDGETTFYDAKSGTFSFTTLSYTKPEVHLLFPESYAKLDSSDVLFQFYYTSGTYGPSLATCSLFVDYALKGSVSSVSPGDERTIQVNELADGYHDWKVVCEDEDPTSSGDSSFEAGSSFSIKLSNAPSITIVHPKNGDVKKSSTIEFAYYYDSGDNGPPVTSCSVYLDGMLEQTDSHVAELSTYTHTISDISSGTHTWKVLCEEDTAAIGSPYTASATFKVELEPVVESKGNGGGTSGGTGTGGTVGSGGGNVNKTSKPKVKTTINPAKTEGGEEETKKQVETQKKVATMSAPAKAYLGTIIVLRITSSDGKPLSGVLLSIIKPNGGIVRMRTDNSGEAKFKPQETGVFKYRSTEYQLAGNLQTEVTEAKAGEQGDGQMPAIRWMDYALIFLGVVAVLGILAGGYMMFSQKPEED